MKLNFFKKRFRGDVGREIKSKQKSVKIFHIDLKADGEAFVISKVMA